MLMVQNVNDTSHLPYGTVCVYGEYISVLIFNFVSLSFCLYMGVVCVCMNPERFATTVNPIPCSSSVSLMSTHTQTIMLSL